MKYGLAPNGKRCYRCQACGRQHREHPGSNTYSEATREMMLLRTLSRTFGASRSTVAAWLRKALTWPLLETSLAPAQLKEALESNEL